MFKKIYMEDLPGYFTGKQASEILKVCQNTLRNWSSEGKIEVYRTPGNKRMYNVGKFLKDNNLVDNEFKEEIIERLTIGYIRVSTNKQIDDLQRQRQELINNYPDIEIIEDIGSGLNLTKKGIKKVVNLAIEGKIEKLIVLYKDRLTRFGYDLIEYLITEYSKGEIIIINKKVDETLEEELVKDVLNILNVYTAKMNGIRKYNKRLSQEIN